MSQFDVYRLGDGELVLDVQSDLIGVWDTRLIVPLIAPDADAQPTDRLNPLLKIDGEPLILATHLATAMSRRELCSVTCSLAAYEYEIKAALDMLISGF